MDLRKVKKLIELLEDSTLSEMEITEGDDTIRLSRASASAAFAPVAMPAVVHTPATQADSSGNMLADTPSVKSTAQRIVSPIVGTFYNSRSPDAAPFISVGDKISEGDIVCIIEAMKTFNEVKSTISGTVVEILKSTGDAVEFDELLFAVE